MHETNYKPKNQSLISISNLNRNIIQILAFSESSDLISVVGSPEVFGHRFVPLPPSSAAVRASTPDSEYERIIERYDLMNATSIPQLSSSSFCTIPSAPQLSLQPPILYPSILLTEANARANNPQNLHEIPVNYSTSLSDFRPPKKRFAEMSSSSSSSELKSSSATSHTTTSAPNRRQYVQHPFINHYSSTQRHYQQPPPPQTSAFVEPNRSTPSLIPSNDQFQEAMNHWDWYQIDDFIMPVVLRANQRYAAVQIVQLKLLSKFPPNIPTEMTAKFIMVSHKMSAIEAWILNSINAVITKFDLGCHLFTPNDEIVRVDDVERFYWSVKEWNMKAMIDRYNAELHDASSTHLMAVITKIRNSVQESIQVSATIYHACTSLFIN
ncbi:unnamed protein product [Anisakis simplex]|uniref:Ras-GEF domain-containing protein n=1 Tax=Anisakis simplex TaxID=6269 RepID=A0A0M3JUQ7_ANISI|nr:unnamed protein product [Anisakis simplex]